MRYGAHHQHFTPPLPSPAVEREWKRPVSPLPWVDARSAGAPYYRRLISDDGRRRKFERLVSELREGQTFSAALFEAYYMTPGDLEREWRADVSERFTALPLIATGSGVWALAMVLAVAAYVRRRHKHHQTIARWAVEEAAVRAVALEDATRRGIEAQRWSDAVAAAQTQALFTDEREAEVPTVRHAGRDHTVH